MRTARKRPPDARKNPAVAGFFIAWILLALASPAAWAACSTVNNASTGCDLGITINTPADIATKRANLINTAYGISTGVLPTTNTPTVTHPVADPFGGSIGGVPLNVAAGGAGVWQFQVNGLNLSAGGWNLNPIYLWQANSPNKNRLVIFNGGHQQTCSWPAMAAHYNMQVNLRRLLAAGYSVLGVNQPGLGAGCTDMSNQHIAMGQALGSQMLLSFFEPNNQIINWLEANMPFLDYNMTGISGGGWETAQYSAIDPRIHVAITVASGIPGVQFIPNGYAGADYVDCPGVSGCWSEAQVAPYYTIAGYMDQMVMSASGLTANIRARQPRLYQQVLNVFDACCWGDSQWFTSFASLAQGYLTYFSTGGGGASQCGADITATTCDQTHYMAYYSAQVAAKVTALGAGGQALPAVYDWVSNYHQTSNCGDSDSFTVTGGLASSLGQTVACGPTQTHTVGGYLDGISLIIGTLDANAPVQVAGHRFFP